MNYELLNNKKLSVSIHRQGSDEWLQERNDLITGSPIDRLMTAPKGDEVLSVGAKTYCMEIVCNIIAGGPAESYSNSDMERGTRLEPIARFRNIERFEDNDPLNPIGIKEVGLIKNSDWPGCGVSLDGVTTDKGITEYKCRKRVLHLAHLNGPDAKTYKQMQFGMGVTGADHGYFCAYSDEYEKDQGDLILHKVERDETMIENMKEKCVHARTFIDAKVKQYRKLIAAQIS